jgi:hypothetical protein
MFTLSAVSRQGKTILPGGIGLRHKVSIKARGKRRMETSRFERHRSQTPAVW